MTKFLLSVHVLAAILAIGPVAVAASAFPRFALRAPDIAVYLHGICRAYALLGLAVPVFGFATAAELGVLTDAWLLASVALTAVAAVLLAAAILPRQQRLLEEDSGGGDGGGGSGGDGADGRRGAARLAMLTGVFNLLWAVVVVLMIVRPGSTTGA